MLFGNLNTDQVGSTKGMDKLLYLNLTYGIVVYCKDP